MHALYAVYKTYLLRSKAARLSLLMTIILYIILVLLFFLVKLMIRYPGLEPWRTAAFIKFRLWFVIVLPSLLPLGVAGDTSRPLNRCLSFLFTLPGYFAKANWFKLIICLLAFIPGLALALVLSGTAAYDLLFVALNAAALFFLSVPMTALFEQMFPAQFDFRRKKIFKLKKRSGVLNLSSQYFTFAVLAGLLVLAELKLPLLNYTLLALSGLWFFSFPSMIVRLVEKSRNKILYRLAGDTYD